MVPMVSVQRRGDRADLVIDRVDKLNALSLELLQQLTDACDQLDAEPHPRVVVVRSADARAFSVGADIDEWAGLGPLDAHRASRAGLRALDAVSHLDAPSIAVVSGHCFGGGLELALACDLRVAVPPTRIGFPEATLGNGTGWGGLSRIVRLIGPGRAKSLLLTGREVGADEARQLGICEFVADSDTFVEKLADRIAGNAPIAVQTMKRLVDAAAPRSATGALGESLSASLYAATDDARHGKQAFKDGTADVRFHGV